MTPGQRKALASRAAHARWAKAVPIATHEAVADIGGLQLMCAVLEDGRRVFSERGLSDAFQHVRSGDEFRLRAQPDAEQLPVFISQSIAAFLSPQARERLANPIRYRHKDGFSVPARGVAAELLPEICDAYLAARDAGALTTPAAHRRARAAEMLLRALAKVGVVALIDEATGFQMERDRHELQLLLSKYIAEEFRPWASLFPTEFYIQMFRLRGVTVADVRRRPAYFGHLTNDVVYDRLLPGVRERLRQVNPVSDETGRRPRAHHQHFTDDGKAHLEMHLRNIVFLMKTCDDWDGFVERLDRAAPKRLAEDSAPAAALPGGEAPPRRKRKA